MTQDVYQAELVAVSLLKPHPRNYRQHPQEQIEHIMQSIREHGFYRNVVAARDYTILAGHGVVQAVERMGLLGPGCVPVIRLDLDPVEPRALKIVASDNEIGKLAESDDRALTALLRDVMTVDDLLGTGFDAQSLAALVMVSRPIEEIRSKNAAAEWLGMPEFSVGEQRPKLIMFFHNEADRDAFVTQSGLKVARKTKNTKNVGVWTAWWPSFEREPLTAQGILFTDGAIEEES